LIRRQACQAVTGQEPCDLRLYRSIRTQLLPALRHRNPTSTRGSVCSGASSEAHHLDFLGRAKRGPLGRRSLSVGSAHPRGHDVAFALGLATRVRLATGQPRGAGNRGGTGNSYQPPTARIAVLYSTAVEDRTRHLCSQGCAVATSTRCEEPVEAVLPPLAPPMSNCIASDWGLGVDESYAQG
jgi:hypothetical protein